MDTGGAVYTPFRCQNGVCVYKNYLYLYRIKLLLNYYIYASEDRVT